MKGHVLSLKYGSLLQSLLAHRAFAGFSVFTSECDLEEWAHLLRQLSIASSKNRFSHVQPTPRGCSRLMRPQVHFTPQTATWSQFEWLRLPCPREGSGHRWGTSCVCSPYPDIWHWSHPHQYGGIAGGTMITSHWGFILKEVHRGGQESVRETPSAPKGPASWRVLSVGRGGVGGIGRQVPGNAVLAHLSVVTVEAEWSLNRCEAHLGSSPALTLANPDLWDSVSSFTKCGWESWVDKIGWESRKGRQGL